MDHVLRRLAVVSATAGVLATGLAAPAAAASDPLLITLTCDGATFDIALTGGGNWSPGRVVGTNQHVLPLAFEEEHFMVTLADGTVLFDETMPARSRGRAPAGAPTYDCDFAFEEAGEPDFPPGSTVSVSGSVTVALVGQGAR